MAKKITDLSIIRRIVVGTSPSAQGADGVGVLTSTAYDAMLAADWTVSQESASIPVHEFDRTLPSGDAWKACYGYDEPARTQRGACGAVCYSVAIPSDALASHPATYALTEDESLVSGKTYYERSGAGTTESPYEYTAVETPDIADIATYYELATEAVAVADIDFVSASIVGDRYLDKGVDVRFLMSSSAVPPKLSTLLSLSAVTLCATESQTATPNKRIGVTETFVANPAQPATSYLHVILSLHDYFGTRGAWIEGGAMLAEESLSITFSRDVASSVTAAKTRLDVGRIELAENSGDSGILIADALAAVPRLSVWARYGVWGVSSVYEAAYDRSVATVLNDMLAFLYSGAGLYLGTGTSNVSSSTVQKLAKTGAVVISSSPGMWFSAFVAHGITRGRTFRGIEFENEIDASNVPMLALVYGIAGQNVIPTAKPCSTIIPRFDSMIDESFRLGESTNILAVSAPSATNVSWGAEVGTEQVSVVPLARHELSTPTRMLSFNRPWKTGEISTILLALLPNGVPKSTQQGVSYAATAAKTALATLQNSDDFAATKTAVPSMTVEGSPGGFLLYQTGIISGNNIPSGSIVLNRSDYFRDNNLFHSATCQVTDTPTLYEEKWVWNSHNNKVTSPSGSKTCSFRTYTNGTFDYGGFRYYFNGEAISQRVSFTLKPLRTLDTMIDGSKSEKGTVTATSTGISTYANVVCLGKIGNNDEIIDFASEDEEALAYAIRNHISVRIKGSDVTMQAPTHAWCMRDINHESLTWTPVNVGPILVTITPSYQKYSWANSTEQTPKVLSVIVGGQCKLIKDGVEYTADLVPVTANAAATLSGKSATVSYDVGDQTETATLAVQIPAIEQTLTFTAANGSTMQATVSSVAQSTTASVTAKEAFNASSVSLSATDTSASATTNEAFASVDDIDLGMPTLYE